MNKYQMKSNKPIAYFNLTAKEKVQQFQILIKIHYIKNSSSLWHLLQESSRTCTQWQRYQFWNRRCYHPEQRCQFRKRDVIAQNRGVSSVKEDVIAQNKGVSSRKENASQPDQDAVPANKRSQKLLSIGETQKLRIVLSPQQEKLYKWFPEIVA